MTQKKYELLKNDTVTAPNGKTLYRIKALIDFDVVVAGSLGGYIEKEDNLAHSGNAWVYGDAWVYGNARVCSKKDLVWFSNVGTEYGTLTVFKTKEGKLFASRGCFKGTVDEFLAKSAKVHNERIKREYQLLIEVAKSRLLGESYVPTF